VSDIIVGPIDDIPVGEGRAYAVDGRQVAIFRLRDGSLRALDAVCPHRGGPLADGLTDAHVVVCARRSGTGVVTSDPDDLRRLDPSLPLTVI